MSSGPSFIWAWVSTTMATLIMELALTRIFSQWSSTTTSPSWRSRSLCSGTCAGGASSYGAARLGNVYQKLGSARVVRQRIGAAGPLVHSPQEQNNDILTLAGVYFATAVPFFLAGTIVSIAISEAIERVHRAYFFDLAGAAVGCLLLIPLFLDVAGADPAP